MPTRARFFAGSEYSPTEALTGYGRPASAARIFQTLLVEGLPVRQEENNLFISSSQANRSVVVQGDGKSAAYTREVSIAAVVCVWAATILASWALVGLVAAGIWWLVG